MNIIFITEDAQRHDFYGRCVCGTMGRERLEHYCKLAKIGGRYIAKDYETTGLDPYTAKPLLLGLGDAEVQYCIDTTTVDISEWYFLNDIKAIGHNIKFDLKFDIVHYNIHNTHVYDTMIASQKVYQGFQKDHSFRFDLASVTERQLNKFRTHGKDTRNDFIGANPSNFVFSARHLEYLAEDLCDLHAIKDSQVAMLKEYKLLRWMNTIEFPLIYHLAQCELNGFEFDSVAWQENIDEAALVRHTIASELDEELRRLRDSNPTRYRARLQGGIYNRKRRFQPRQLTIGLFGEMSTFDFYSAKGAKGKNVSLTKKGGKAKIKANPNNINWGSDTNILYIFACLEELAPLQGLVQRKYKYLVPIVQSVRDKAFDNYGITQEKKKVNFHKEAKNGFTFGKDSLTKYLVDYPDTRMKHLILLLKQWREANHEINSFGENFFDKLNPVTGRIHTEFRQANAVNSRFQSGGGKLQPDKYNAQNIPRKEKFRQCFKGAEHESVVTCDLSGAELRVLTDKSRDEKLYEWGIMQDDTHSPMIQNVWRHILLYRVGMKAKAWFNEDGFFKFKNSIPSIDTIRKHKSLVIRDLFEKAVNFTVSKTVNKAYRQAGKNGTFGGLYGMKITKAAETFNNTDSELMKIDKNYTPVRVTQNEGSIILRAQKAAIPKAYEYVQSNVEKGFSHGYIEYDFKSHSRIWFQSVLILHAKIVEEHEEMFGFEPNIVHLGNGKYKALETGLEYELDNRDKKDVDGQSRNIPISGTQSDCIKEAIVDIMNYVVKHKLSIKWLSQVHDELVFSMPKRMDGKSAEFKDNPEYVVFTYDKPVEKSIIDYSYNKLTYTTNDEGDERVKHVELAFPEFVRQAMIQASNRHMKYVQMDADYKVQDSWTK